MTSASITLFDCCKLIHIDVEPTSFVNRVPRDHGFSWLFMALPHLLARQKSASSNIQDHPCATAGLRTPEVCPAQPELQSLPQPCRGEARPEKRPNIGGFTMFYPSKLTDIFGVWTPENIEDSSWTQETWQIEVETTSGFLVNCLTCP